jgi:AcrR family transcriptional regulator
MTTAPSPAPVNGAPVVPASPDRRARRRQETIEEILEIAQQIMTEEGVNGLSLAEVARRLGVQPPSIYKYYPSLMAVYDELFRRGHAENLEVMRQAIDASAPGLAAISAGLNASGRWLLTHRALAQLLFWRPVPKFEPSPEAFAPAIEMVAIQRAQLANAVALGEVGPAADSEEAMHLISILITGVLSQAMANEPDLAWGEGRFTPLFPKLMTLVTAAYPPPASPSVETGSAETGRERVQE